MLYITNTLSMKKELTSDALGIYPDTAPVMIAWSI